MALLTTDPRFAVPPLPPHHVSRRRLLATLDESAIMPLTLVCAGAGAGKTVLLTEWSRQRPEPVVWLALTREDNDPRRFWRVFLEAGRVGGHAYPPSAWTPGHPIKLVDSVYARLGHSQLRVTVVLDDAHVLTDPQILEGLDRVVVRWSHALRLLMTARSDPLLPLHRYRVAGQVREIRAAELAMTAGEARELLRQHGISLPEGEARKLTERTEGWPAGLRLAALRMQGDRRPEAFVELLATGQGSIAVYLTEEVLAVQPEQTGRLLIETSFLDEVTGPLADTVTGLTGCAELLSGLARTNSFVIPVDAAQTTFRYHQLFREVLRYLAEGQPSAQVQQRYRRAADWYRAHHDLSNALQWTMRSHDVPATRSLLLHGGLAEVFVTGQDVPAQRLRAVIEDGPPAGASELERLEFDIACWAVAALTAEAADAATVLDELPPLEPQLGGAEPDLVVSALLAKLIIGRKANDIVLIARSAEQLITNPVLSGAARVVPGLRAAVLLLQARSRFATGQLAEVEPLLSEALREARFEDAPAVRLTVLSVMAFIATITARWRHAEQALGEATQLTQKYPALIPPPILDAAIARRAELAADWAAMGSAVDRALAAGPVYPDHGMAATIAYIQATYLIGVGRLAEARDVLRNNRALAVTVGPLAVRRDRELAEIEIELGRSQSALRLLAPYQRSRYGMLVAVTSARAHIALGDLQEAAACIRSVLTSATPFVDRQMTIEALLCDAMIAERTVSDGKAAELLDRALDIAQGDIALPFVRSYATFAPLLARHPAVAGRWPAVAADRAEPVREASPETGAALRAELTDPLTSREQAVLRLMGTTMSTAEIADDLFVSVNTVKTHLAAIYRKLGVSRRRQAVLRARDLELL